MKFLKEEDAVSPVIGVILMVAITVILAAVIAAFVFGMAGSVQKTKTVAATAKQVGNEFVITYQGGADDASVEYLTIQYLDNGTTFWYDDTATPFQVTPEPVAFDADNKPAVGTSLASGGATLEQDHVVVTVGFNDGSAQVILDTYV
ncbi:MAG: type IV pilin N-terminal domain-containing protein [Methanomicrobiales archaeon]|nr:type IV pilin N-terminal domain-containing protein [Methanomicrobiales archaeon]